VGVTNPRRAFDAATERRHKRDESESRREASSLPKEPNARQEEILQAFALTPNAAAVGRALRTNERHVRRVLKQFPERVDELCRERDQERRERAEARKAKVQEWLDESLDGDIARLDTLVANASDSVALSAIKLKFHIALIVPPAPSAPSEIERALEELERGLAHRISETEVGVEEQEGEGE
jgi:hypothetical protein